MNGLKATTLLIALYGLIMPCQAQSTGRAGASPLFEPWRTAPMMNAPAFSEKQQRAQKQRPGALSIDRATPAVTSASLPDYVLSSPAALPEHLRRRMVEYPTNESPTTIVVDTPNAYLYFVVGDGKAWRYGIGVGREGFTWSGRQKISRMAEWPDWRPPQDMIERQPELPDFVPGGLNNPLGARALYLGDTLYRIHGTNEPSTIGTFSSSGCIRMLNDDVIDLYRRVSVGSVVVVLPARR